MIPFWLLEVIFWSLIAADAVLAYMLRQRALFCVAALAFLPFIPAVFRYLTADPSIVLPSGAESTRVFVIAVMSFAPVWVGFGAGLLFDWLNSGIPAAVTEKPADVAVDRDWRESLAEKQPDV